MLADTIVGTPAGVAVKLALLNLLHLGKEGCTFGSPPNSSLSIHRLH